MPVSIERYSRVAMTLHWLIALAIIANLALGLYMADMEKGPLRFEFFQLHKSLGITVLALTLLRLIWRFYKAPPPLVDTLQPWEKLIANVTYVFFYLLMLGLPLSGWALVSSSPLRLPTLLYGVVPLPALPFFEGVADRKALSHQIGDVHEWLAYIMIALLCLHIAAVIRHHWILRDSTLLRMTPKALGGSLNAIRGKK
jgi:cytochrome b561